MKNKRNKKKSVAAPVVTKKRGTFRNILFILRLILLIALLFLIYLISGISLND